VLGSKLEIEIAEGKSIYGISPPKQAERQAGRAGVHKIRGRSLFSSPLYSATCIGLLRAFVKYRMAPTTPHTTLSL
jgi:hypothetical protein